MAEYAQIPGNLDLVATRGDDFQLNLAFNIDLTGYTLSANVVTVSTNVLIPLTITNTNLSLGEIKLSLPKTTLASLSTSIHHWRLDWNSGSLYRKALSGNFQVIDYPEEIDNQTTDPVNVTIDEGSVTVEITGSGPQGPQGVTTGASGNFISSDGKHITVVNGLITVIV